MAWPPITHQDVQDEIGNAFGWATGLLQRVRMGESLASTGGAVWIAGRYYGSNAIGASSTLAVAASRLYVTAFYAPQPRAIDRVSINVTTAGAAGTVARVGVYKGSPDTGVPTTVHVDAGTVPTDTTGIKEATVTATLHGFHWLAFVSSGTPTVGSYSNAHILTVTGGATAATSSVPSAGRDTVTATDPLPDLTGAALIYGISGNPPAVTCRAV